MVKRNKRRDPSLQQLVLRRKPTDNEEETENIERSKDTAESTSEQWVFYGNCRFLTTVEQGYVLPLLMLPNCFPDGSRQIFDFTTGNYYKIYLPESYGFRCCGSSEGWLIMVHDSLKLTFLLHPYSRAQIHLPQGSNLPVIPEQYHPMLKYKESHPTIEYQQGCGPYFIRKAIVSWSSTTSSNLDCVVAAIDSSGKLFFCRPGDEQWMSFNDEHFEDIISHQGYFFAMDRKGLVTSFDLGPNPRATAWDMVVTIPIEDTKLCHTKYLVESSGEFLMVSRTSLRYFDEIRNTYAYMSTGLCAYKLDHSINPNWTKVENLGDQMLFIGRSCSKSLWAGNLSMLKGNYIYFTDDNFHRYHAFGLEYECRDSGGFALDNKQVHFYPNFESSPESPPIWILPPMP